MPLGILEDYKLDNVPGTGLLSAKVNQISKDEVKELKRGTGRHAHIVLIPQPSDDPRDPLNWPKWKKEACFWTLTFAAALASAMSPLASSPYVLLAKEFHVPINEVASSFSANMLGSGIFALLQSPIAVKYGHRILYLLSTFLIFVSCIWAALSTNLKSICASRVFQGFGVAPIHSLLAVTIENLFFVHERGTRSSIWFLFQFGCPVLSSIINSYVIQNLSWRLGFWFTSIAWGFVLIGVFVFVPETTYCRAESASYDSRRTEHLNTTDKAENTSGTSVLSVAEIHDIGHRSSVPSSNSPTFLSQLKIYNGTFCDQNVWKIFLRPFPFLLSPVTWFMVMSYVIPTVSSNLVAVCASTIYTVACGFDTGQIGLTHMSTLVGALFAIVVTGPLGDRLIVWMSQRNRGIYEPEYRLIFMLGMLLSASGYIGWAFGNDNNMPWIGAITCSMIATFGVAVSYVALFGYLIDMHGNKSLHIISLIQFATNMITYAMTFFANGVVLSAGIKLSLLVVGCCQAVGVLACIPMYIYGKRARSFVARHPRLFGGDLSASDSSESVTTSETGSKC